jgi:hypothetical protein
LEERDAGALLSLVLQGSADNAPVNEAVRMLVKGLSYLYARRLGIDPPVQDTL